MNAWGRQINSMWSFLFGSLDLVEPSNKNAPSPLGVCARLFLLLQSVGLLFCFLHSILWFPIYDPFLSYPLMGMWIGIVYFRWVDGLLMKWWGREDERDLGKFLWVNEWVLVGVSWQNIGMIRVGPTGKVLLDCERTRVQLLRELILLGGLTCAGQQMGGPRPL